MLVATIAFCLAVLTGLDVAQEMRNPFARRDEIQPWIPIPIPSIFETERDANEHEQKISNFNQAIWEIITK